MTPTKAMKQPAGTAFMRLFSILFVFSLAEFGYTSEFAEYNANPQNTATEKPSSKETISTDNSSEETTVIAQRLASESDSGWSINVITRQTLVDNPPEHIQQVLNASPGMNIQRGNGAEYLPSLRSPVLTGAGACGNLLIMEEGIRLRGAGVCNINELFDAHHEQASQIEILKGPSSAFHGANALLGAIDVRLNVTNESSLSIDWGHRDFYRARLTKAYAQGDHRGTFYTTLSHDAGWRDESGFEQQKLSWRHELKTPSWQLNPGFTIANLNQETAGFITGRDAYKDRDAIESNPTPEAYRDSKAGRLWLHAKRKFNDSSQLLITPYVRHTEMAFLQHFLPGDPLEDNRQTSVGLQTSMYQNLSSTWHLSYGIDVDKSQTFLKQSQDAPTEGSAFLVATIPQGEHYNYDVDIYSIAAFAQTQFDISQRFQLSGGIRAEQVEYDYRNNLPAGRTRDNGTECGFGGCRYSRPESGKDRFNNISPNLALSYQLDSAKLFASVGQNYRPPQTSELYRLQRAQNKADLDNVRTNYLNTGLEISHSYFTFRVEAYHQNLSNLIIRDVDFFNVDNARAKSTGIETVLTLQSEHFASKLTFNWAKHRYGDNQFIGTDADGNPVDVSENDVDTAPKRFGQWQFEWRPQDSIYTQLTVEYTDQYYLEPLNTHIYEGHTLAHWNTVWNLNEKTKIRFKINNLLDKRYATRADFTSFSGYRYFPGEPRTAFVGLDMKF